MCCRELEFETEKEKGKEYTHSSKTDSHTWKDEVLKSLTTAEPGSWYRKTEHKLVSSLTSQ